MKQSLLCVFAVLTLALAFAPLGRAQVTQDEQGRTVLKLDSQEGDPVGAGQQYEFTVLDGSFTVQSQPADSHPYSYHGPSVSVTFQGETRWNLFFAAPIFSALVPGLYEGAANLFFADTPLKPSLVVEGRSCGRLSGRFVVLDLAYDAQVNVTRFAADFEQHCEDHAAALYGAIRYHSQVPLEPVLSIASASSVFEGSPLDFVVSLSEPALVPVTVDYATADGTAKAGSNYVSTSGTLTFAPGETSKTVQIETLDDGVAHRSRSLTVGLSSPSGAGVAFGVASGTMLDHDGPQTLLVAESPDGNLYPDPRTMTVLDGLFRARGDGHAVDVMFDDGGSEWNFSSATLSFAAAAGARLVPGVYANATADWAPSPTHPMLGVNSGWWCPFSYGVTEGFGRFVVYEAEYSSSGKLARFAASFEQRCRGYGHSWESPWAHPVLSYGEVRFNSTYPVPHHRNRFEFSAPRYRVSESTRTAVVTVRRLAPGDGSATVDYSTRDGGATAAQDYKPVSGTLTFRPGETERTFEVPITKDALEEANEAVLLELSNPRPLTNGASLGPQNTAVLTIADDDATGAVRFGKATASVDASNGSTVATINLVRTGGLASGVTVHCTMTDLSAVGGVDYDSSAQDVTFTSTGTGASLQPLHVPVSQNTAGAKTFSVTLSAPTGGATLSTPSVAIVTILGGQPTLSFSRAAYTVETTAGTALITVTRSMPLTGTVTVQYATSAGSATPGGGDYTDVSGTLAFGPGVATRSFAVPITNDRWVDSPKAVNLLLTSPTWSLGSAAVDAILGSATLAIVNPHAPPVVQFGAATFAVGEAAGLAHVVVQRTGDLAGTVTAAYAVTGGTATNGDGGAPEADYRLKPGVLTFGPGVMARTIDVAIVNDTRKEGTETVLLSLSNPTWTNGTASLGATGSTTLKIVDDEPTVQFSQAMYTVSEAAGKVTVSVVRRGSKVAGTVAVSYAVTGGSAVPGTGKGADYVPLPAGTLTFAAGQAVRTLTITLRPDTSVEGTRTIELRLSSPRNAGLGSPSTTVVRIGDDDVAGKVQFGAPVFSVMESAGVATVTVTRSGGTAGGVAVDYATVTGDPNATAVAGVDYTASSGTLTFGVNETRKTFTVPVLADGVASDGAVSVRLSLGSAAGGLALGAPSTATLWILKE